MYSHILLQISLMRPRAVLSPQFLLCMCLTSVVSVQDAVIVIDTGYEMYNLILHYFDYAISINMYSVE